MTLENVGDMEFRDSKLVDTDKIFAWLKLIWDEGEIGRRCRVHLKLKGKGQALMRVVI